MVIESMYVFTGDEVVATDLPAKLNENFAKTENGITNLENRVIPIEKGGTGATSVAGARNALGLGNTTGALPIANGGTGATTASQACVNLGAVRTVNGTAPDANGNVKVPGADVSSLVNIIYPVGSLYWSKKSTDPATLFGGTWARIKDKFILAAGDSYAQGATGGSATVTLTTNQIPAHTHGGSIASDRGHTHGASSNNVGGHTHSISVGGSEGGTATLGYDFYNYTTLSTSSAGSHSHTITVNNGGSHTHGLTINNSGGGQAHDNMPPYVAYYCWERTA